MVAAPASDRIVAASAAIPDEKASADSPPSMSASFASSARMVGLWPKRVYRLPSTRPSTTSRRSAVEAKPKVESL